MQKKRIFFAISSPVKNHKKEEDSQSQLVGCKLSLPGKLASRAYIPKPINYSAAAAEEDDRPDGRALAPARTGHAPIYSGSSSFTSITLIGKKMRKSHSTYATLK